MKKQTSSRVICVFVLIFLFSNLSFAQTAQSDAQKVILEIASLSKTLDDPSLPASTRENTKKIIESFIDFETLTKNSLGQRATSIAQNDLAQIQSLLKTILTETIYPVAPKFFRGVEIEFSPSTGNQISSKVISRNDKGQIKRSAVDYWISPSQAKNPNKIIDLAVEGERWVENVHHQFDEIIQKKGIAGLIQKMKKRAAEIKNETKAKK